MPTRVDFDYDKENNIVFSVDSGEISTPKDVDDFFNVYKKFWESLGKKAWLVANIDELMVHGQVSDYYAQVARSLMGKHVIGFARWGTNNWARMSVRTTALKAKMPSTIHSSKAEAIAAVEEMKRTGYRWVNEESSH